MLEAVGVELGFVPIEFLRKGDNGLSVQRMGGLTLQILENPPKRPQMTEIIIQNPPPDERRPRSRGPHRTRPPADSTYSGAEFEPGFCHQACTAPIGGAPRARLPQRKRTAENVPRPPPGINLRSGGADR